MNKLTKQEEAFLEIEQFLLEMKDFLKIQNILVQLHPLSSEMKFNKIKKFAPLIVIIKRYDGLYSEYIFQNYSDDEYPQLDKDGNHVDYYKMKDIISEHLKKTLNNKSVYTNISASSVIEFHSNYLDNNLLIKNAKIKNEYFDVKSSLLIDHNNSIKKSSIKLKI